MVKLAIEITLPCGCPFAFATESVSGYESLHYVMKYASEVLKHQVDFEVENHHCEGGHAD